jgi:hypothetical protein
VSLPKLVEFAVWSHLDQVENIELVLLKGHLLLESVIDSTLSTLFQRGSPESLNLTFHRKLELLAMLHRGSESDFNLAKALIVRLNKLRNRLAHELMFEGGRADLEEWSGSVLSAFPGIKFSKYTFRTKVVHAFATLARVLCTSGGQP